VSGRAYHRAEPVRPRAPPSRYARPSTRSPTISEPRDSERLVTVIIEDYRSTRNVDAQLASLGYAAVHGWPDQRPLTGPWSAHCCGPPA
jgi:hypothetical protein